MKNLLLFIIAALISSVALNAQTAPNPNAAKMNFEFETFDFGDIEEGADAQVDFNFTNTGQEKLIITNVKASCGCTTPFWSKEPVQPGADSKITAKYNTVNKSGRFNKSITITSNSSTATKRIFIKGNVVPAPTNDGVPERTPSIVNQLGPE